jgi:hypothetical protein
MNPYFLPNDHENDLILTIQKYCRNEYALIRMTETMLDKSIIDASDSIRNIMRENGIVNYGNIAQGQKVMEETDILCDRGILRKRMSLYRPKTKNGDPRFWVYQLGALVEEGDLIYFTYQDGRLVAIPLISHPRFEDELTNYFGKDDIEEIIEEFCHLVSKVKRRGWIPSVSPTKRYAKDVGDTLEHALGIKVNNLVSADYKGHIEVKGKRASARTRDTLFSMVPDWEISNLKSSTDIMLSYGYPSTRHSGFIDLFVTVNQHPNNQGLFIVVDEEQQMVHQMSLIAGVEREVCSWRFEDIKARLEEKHPNTMWILAEEKVLGGVIHFKYTSVQFTRRPVFSQFLTLLQQGVVTYDWRGRVKPDRTGYNDKGHCFRLVPSKRNLLFGELSDLYL